MYLFALPAMAGVHGCGCWEAGAISSTKAFHSSAWTQRGPIHRLAHSSSTAPRIRCSLRGKRNSWAASGGDTTGWWRWRRRRGGLLYIKILETIFSIPSSRLRAHNGHSSSCKSALLQNGISVFFIWGKTVIECPPFSLRWADPNAVTVSP